MPKTTKPPPKPPTAPPKRATKPPNAIPKSAIPKSFHFDRHAAAIADDLAADSNLPDRDPHNDPNNDLLLPAYVAEKLRCSIQWLDSARCLGYSPPFIKLGPRMVRYPRGKLERWLRNRPQPRRRR